MTEVIEEGHGLTDITCEHGSRWIWWDEQRRARHINRWVQVIIAPGCDCGEPPCPYSEEKEDSERS